jgi:hypothetical protein
MQNFRSIVVLILIFITSFCLKSQEWKRNIAPMVGYRNGATRDTLGNVNMIEVGAAFITGTRNVSNVLWQPVYGWRYFGPFVSIDGKFRPKYALGSNAMMLNVGITGGAGGFFASVFPAALNGILSYSTDFKHSFMRLGISYDLCFISFGGGVLSNISGGSNLPIYDNQLYFDIRLLLWKEGGYRR